MADEVIPSETITIGRIVHYVVPIGLSRGECRAAMIIRPQDQVNNLVRLRPFLDEEFDSDAILRTETTVSSAYSATGGFGSFHFHKECWKQGGSR